MKHLVLVAGMHRSGTSMLANVCKNLGAALPFDGMPKDIWNPDGYGESMSMYCLNQDILKDLNQDWFDFGSELTDAQLLALKEKFIPRATALIRSPKFLGQEILMDTDGSLVIKDPRILRLFPFWQSVFEDLGLPIIVLPIVRNPIEVAYSMFTRDGINLEIGLGMWIATYLALARTNWIGADLLYFDDAFNDQTGFCKKVLFATKKGGLQLNEGALESAANGINSGHRRHWAFSRELPSSEANLLANRLYQLSKSEGLSCFVAHATEIAGTIERLLAWYPHWRELFIRYSELLNGMRSLQKRADVLLGPVSK